LNTLINEIYFLTCR